MKLGISPAMFLLIGACMYCTRVHIYWNMNASCITESEPQMLFGFVEFFVFSFFRCSCAFVSSQMKRRIDSVLQDVPFYYVWFIVQHKQFDSLISFHLVLAARLSR